MRKSTPSPTAIARAGHLTRSEFRHADPMTTCNICGKPSPLLMLYRECDQHDKPRPGDAALLFVDSFEDEHEPCRRAVDNHPRLYIEERGNPGTFPQLCGPCVHRRGFACEHPSLKSNGGAGLSVKLDGLNAIVCSRKNGCSTPLKRAFHCAGREVRT